MRSIQNKLADQINYLKSDQDQYCPYQIVDLLFEIRNGLRSHLRSRGEDVSQEQYHRYRDQEYRHQLVHGAMPLRSKIDHRNAARAKRRTGPTAATMIT
jgi:hypothetical protein